MSVDVSHQEVRVVQVTGEIDFSNVEGMSQEVDRAVEESPAGFILDLTGAEYIDSAVISVVIRAYRRLCPEGRLALAVRPGPIAHIVSLIHPERLPGMIVCPDVASAERAIREGRD